jgi:hypothetical protein
VEEEVVDMISIEEARKWACGMAEKTSYFWMIASAALSLIIFSVTHILWLSVSGLGCGLFVIILVRLFNYGPTLGFQKDQPDKDDFEQLE